MHGLHSTSSLCCLALHADVESPQAAVMAKDLILFIYAPHTIRPKDADLLHESAQVLASEATAGVAQVSHAHFWDFAGFTPRCVVMVNAHHLKLPITWTPTTPCSGSLHVQGAAGTMRSQCLASLLQTGCRHVACTSVSRQPSPVLQRRSALCSSS